MARKKVTSYAIYHHTGAKPNILLLFQGSGGAWLSGIPFDEARFVVDLLRNEKPVFYDQTHKRLSTMAEPVGEEEKSRPDIDAWMNAHSAIAESIVWEDADGPHAWPSWGKEWKAELRDVFDQVTVGLSIPVTEVPPNLLTLSDDQFVETVVSASYAWAYFKASVAQSLAVEIGEQLSWSVQSYSAEQLAQLFDSREMFVWNEDPAGYRINPNHGSIVPAAPWRSFTHLGSFNLIGDTRMDTIARVIDWARINLHHYFGSRKAANMEDHWQYRGDPPMIRVLNGTTKLSASQAIPAHWTAGCSGTTGFLRAILRVVNIPVKLITVTKFNHAQPWFMADACYLSHGDDPYNKMIRTEKSTKFSQLMLINQAKYDSWFGDDVTEDQKVKNIGRTIRELALTYLPNDLLSMYCKDLKNGKTHENSEVFQYFSTNYTLAQLEAWKLWKRIDDKIASLGGCDTLF